MAIDDDVVVGWVRERVMHSPLVVDVAFTRLERTAAACLFALHEMKQQQKLSCFDAQKDYSIFDRV